MDNSIPVSIDVPKEGERVLVWTQIPYTSEWGWCITTYTRKYGFEMSKVEYWQPLPVKPDENWAETLTNQ